MLVSAEIVVVLMGIVIVLLSLWGVASPVRLMRRVRSVMDESWGMHFAVVVRIILGISLLVAAPASKFVVLFKALGWLTLIAAAALIGHKRLVSVIDWFQGFPRPAIRLWLMFGVLFGAFVVYGITGVVHSG